MGFVFRLIRIFLADGFDFQQRKETFLVFGRRIWPAIMSPVWRSKRRICDGET